MARKKKESVKFDVNSEKSKEFVAPMDKFLRLSSLLFNDEDDVIRIEYVGGDVGLLADADFNTMNDAILKFQNDNP